MTVKAPNPKLDAALEFYRNGYSPWPILVGQKMPIRVNGRTWGGRRHVPLTEDEIVQAWTPKRPGASAPDVGVVIREGHFVLDLDPKNSDKVEAMFPELLALTKCAYTRNKGLHAYFSCDGKQELAHPALGVDLVGFGGFVVAPPSQGYTWANELPEAKR